MSRLIVRPPACVLWNRRLVSPHQQWRHAKETDTVIMFSYKNAVYCRQTQQVSTPPSSPPIEWGVQDKVARCLCRVRWIHTEATRPLVQVEAVRWWAQREVVSSIRPTRHCASINKYIHTYARSSQPPHSFNCHRKYPLTLQHRDSFCCMPLFDLRSQNQGVSKSILGW